jgi:hypothetical protein
MYRWLWRQLPGATAARTFQALVLLSVVVAVLMLIVFPALDPHLPFAQDTVRR